MIHGAMQLHVKDFDAFLQMLGENKTFGAQYGLLCTKIYRNTDDPNLVLMVVEWSTDEHIAQFIEDTTPMMMNFVTSPPVPFNVSEYYEIVS